METKESERYLKRVLKRKVSITKAVVVSFLIAGFFGVSQAAYAYKDEEIDALIKGGANITLGGMGGETYFQ